MSNARDPLARYAVQARVERLGRGGQERLSRAAVLVVGTGALGCSAAQQLVRGGVGTVVLVDFDRVELGNLHRQVLFTEADARAGRLKAEAAAERLAEANAEVTVRAEARRFEAASAGELLAGVDLALDCTDNLSTRFLLNERCAALGLPWVYGGVAATHGMLMPIVPGRSACLRCLFDEPPAGAPEPSTAATYGVLGPTPAAVGAFEAAAAMRLLTCEFVPPTRLTTLDLWTGECDSTAVHPAPDCPVCGSLGSGPAAGPR